MLNRKKKCFLAVSLAVKTTFVSVLQENSSVKIKFRFSLSPKIITWTIQACESSPSQSTKSVRTKWPLVFLMESSSCLDRASSPEKVY